MEGLATQSPHIGATATQAQQLGLTFTYTPADIQGLAEPAAQHRGGPGGVPRQHPNLHATPQHGALGGLQAGQRPQTGMVIAQPAPLPMTTSRQQGEERGLCLFECSANKKIMDTPWLWLVSLGMRVNVGVEKQQGSVKQRSQNVDKVLWLCLFALGSQEWSQIKH